MTEKEIAERVKASMSEKRFLHTLGCVEMAEKLARLYGADVELSRRAAYLHDITKEMSYSEQLKLVDRFGIILSRTQRSEKIIHAFSGAVLAKEEFGECDEVCDAIRWHTTARAGMTLLEKVIWVSDLVEEGRTFPGVEKLRSLAFENLSDALILGFDTTLRRLSELGSEIDTNMIEAREFELSSRKE